MIRGERNWGRVKPEEKILRRWKRRSDRLRTETYAICLACKDPRVPCHVKLFIACVIEYVFNPIDLIPDFIPILGYVDDLILVPIGIAIAIKMIPPSVLPDCREKARGAKEQKTCKHRVTTYAGIVGHLLFSKDYWRLEHGSQLMVQMVLANHSIPSFSLLRNLN